MEPKFGRFLALPNFRGQDFQKLYTHYEPCIATDRLEKFHEDIPTSSEVIEAHTLNLKPNFTFSRLQFLGRPLSPMKCALARIGQSLVPKCSLNRKIQLVDSILANITFLFVDQSSRDLFYGTREESLSMAFLSDFGYLDWSHSEDIRNQSRKLSKIALNFPRFFALPNLRGPAFRNLYQCYDPCLAARRMENILWGYFHYPEVIVANTLNFKANFKFSRLKFFWGPPSHFGCALSRLGQSLACV